MSLKKGLLSASLALSAFAAPAVTGIYSPAQAEEKTGYYGVLSIGSDSLGDPKWDTSVGGTAYGGKAQLSSEGAAYELGVGYDWGKWRTDVTYTQSDHDLDSCSETKQNAACTTGSQGTGELKTYMLTGYYDFPTNSKFTPYLGAGIGSTRISPNSINVAGTNYDLDSEDTLTYQLKAGVSYEVGKKTDLLAEASYRKYDDINSDTPVAGVKFGINDIDSWGVRFGLRQRF
ncbi:outer membrane protein [Prochlorococcus sp. MIT 1307]|uniref:outer membrane protein n=1 Tax=Prochlorococcus sp. MIT 1307 TaxID=3096219 RepID=UPI002A755255|nr:OmpW family outer membrane protein [Prochlorococcus sp. MIT 1307]